MVCGVWCVGKYFVVFGEMKMVCGVVCGVWCVVVCVVVCGVWCGVWCVVVYEVV